MLTKKISFCFSQILCCFVTFPRLLFILAIFHSAYSYCTSIIGKNCKDCLRENKILFWVINLKIIRLCYQ